MANIKSNAIDTVNNCDDESIDINEKLIKFLSYLEIDDDCQMLLKPSEMELQNEIKFKQRAEQILKHHHKHDQIIIENKIINDLQQCISALTNDLDEEIDKEKLESKDIIKIYDKIMNLKMLNIKESKNIKSLKEFTKLNKNSLTNITKIEKEIKVVLDKLPSTEKSSKNLEIKIPHTLNNTKDCRSSLSLSNTSRRTDQDANSQAYPRSLAGRIRRLGNLTNNDIVIDSRSYTNELLRFNIENEHSRIVENCINRSNIDQNTRYRQNEDLGSNDFMMGSVDDLVEFSSLNSTVNLYKDNNEDNTSEDVHLILHPL